MAGIYIHIPYCKQKCSYCNFHFSTNQSSKDALLKALKKEISLRRGFFGPEKIKTIYFGGGTPSILSIDDLVSIFDSLKETYDLNHLEEITLEANPDDLSEDYVLTLKNSTPINRLSIGVQSFSDQDLSFMNRAHTMSQAKKALELGSSIGFINTNVDLIFALPWRETEDYLKENFKILSDYDITHLSCYQLTVEPKTLLKNQIKKGQLKEKSDESIVRQFALVQELAERYGFGQYEISNYCKDDHYALHNTAYWKRKTYLGIGPSAHSFKGNARYWNIANNALYIKAIENDALPHEIENLSPTDVTNEIIMTGLRTKWGVDTSRLMAVQNMDDDHEFWVTVRKMKNENLVHLNDGILTLTKEGKVLSDWVSSQLFLEEE